MKTVYELLDEFEHECFMLRVEASETRAKDKVVREAYERIREESAQAIAATLGNDRVTENSIDRWLREFQFEHGELAHIGSEELKDLAFALHDDIPLGYEGSMRLADWLLHATLESGKLTTKQVEKVIRKYAHDTSCYIFEVYGEMCKFIADELNATLGGGECEFVIEDNMNESEGMGDVWFRCTNCDTTFDYYADDWLMKQNYCPHCGFKIRKAVKR